MTPGEYCSGECFWYTKQLSEEGKKTLRALPAVESFTEGNNHVVAIYLLNTLAFCERPKRCLNW